MIPISSHNPIDKPATEQGIGSVLGLSGPVGAVLRFLRRFALPAVALGAHHLYRVMLEGTGFELRVESSSPDDYSPTGFVTTRFVAARSRPEAEALAKAHVLREWQGLSLLGHLTGTCAANFAGHRSQRNRGLAQT